MRNDPRSTGRNRIYGLLGLMALTGAVWALLLAPPWIFPKVANPSVRDAIQGVLHLVFHGAMTWQARSVSRSWLGRERTSWTWMGFGLANAVLDEVVQHWIPGRTCDWRDLACNLAGVALAVAVGKSRK